MKTTLLTSLIAFLLMNAAFSETPIHFPQVSGKDLNGTPWTAPSGFPAERTLVVVGFEEVQQAGIDTWLAGFDVKNPAAKIPWIEMPLIQNPGMFMRWFINTGMRGGIPDKETRAHVWSAYTDKKAFMQACGMDTEQTVYALVVDREGRVLASESGNYTESGAEKLKKKLLHGTHF